MLYLLKEYNYFIQLQNEVTNILYINSLQKENFSFIDLVNIISEKLYENIFLEGQEFVEMFREYINIDNMSIYIYIQNLSKISSSISCKCSILMEKPILYENYMGEIERFFQNKMHIPEIPHYLQTPVIKYFIINTLKKIKSKKSFKITTGQLSEIFFYRDFKVALQMLYILHQSEI
jgi:hypothetical protein